MGPMSVIVHHRAKFNENRSKGCTDIASQRFFFKMAVRYLGFVGRVLGPPTMTT